MLHQQNFIVKQTISSSSIADNLYHKVIHKREVALATSIFSIQVIALIVKFKVQEPIVVASDSSQNIFVCMIHLCFLSTIPSSILTIQEFFLLQNFATTAKKRGSPCLHRPPLPRLVADWSSELGTTSPLGHCQPANCLCPSRASAESKQPTNRTNAQTANTRFLSGLSNPSRQFFAIVFRTSDGKRAPFVL